MTIGDLRKKHTGFVDDLDYSCLVDSQHHVDAHGNRGSPLSDDDFNVVHKLKRELKEGTGTLEFISIALLRVERVAVNGEPVKSEPIEHAVCHDLESFYWLLIWIVLHHTNHSSVHGALACSKLFSLGTEGDAFDRKIGHMGMVPLILVTDAYQNRVMSSGVPSGDDDVKGGEERCAIPLTYELVLQAFNRALAMDGWPENDKAIPFIPHTTHLKIKKPGDGTLNFGNGGKQKGSMRASGQPELPPIPELPIHNGAYDSTHKGPDVPRLRSPAPIVGPSGTATGPSASGAASTKCRAWNWSKILPAREQHKRKVKRARQN
ncbi:hypothetical protein WOLCODRAFT_158732 [Wolfiporia cocos MD-104 SS10]|uniref:Fungal-type protein kinase domain-containing protein n=1 Tax=Wolfiporia cocos (strain MD-104) TaxID=742152 RepID=A0A2H3JH71_WOLCO|nr:hypothetical protein WOLCODRAFT_158732 [Wolfiporia cocos MD-104 SS10]